MALKSAPRKRVGVRVPPRAPALTSADVDVPVAGSWVRSEGTVAGSVRRQHQVWESRISAGVDPSTGRRRRVPRFVQVHRAGRTA